VGRFFLNVAGLPVLLFLAGCDTSAGRLLARGYNISPAFLNDSDPPLDNSYPAPNNAKNSETVNTQYEQPLSWDDEYCQRKYNSVLPQWKSLPVDCAYLHRGFLPPIHLKSYRFDNDSELAIKEADDDSTGSKRNKLKDTLVERSDRICASNKAQIASTKDTVNFGFGAAGAVAGGVGGVVSGVAANVMSSVSGLMSGLQGIAGKDYWQGCHGLRDHAADYDRTNE
jgi:hypothetical protein